MDSPSHKAQFSICNPRIVRDKSKFLPNRLCPVQRVFTFRHGADERRGVVSLNIPRHVPTWNDSPESGGSGAPAGLWSSGCCHVVPRSSTLASRAPFIGQIERDLEGCSDPAGRSPTCGDGALTSGGSPPPGDQLSADGRAVVAFDFDGTITRRDTMLLFLTAVRSRPAVARVFLRRSPQLLMALRGGSGRDRAKRLVSSDILGGLTREEAEAAARYTAGVVGRSLVRSDTAARLLQHQQAGHRVVVVSASFEAYVEPVVRQLGVHEVIATRWEVDQEGILTGGLAGPNVRGPAKVDLLAGLLGDEFRLDYAYGNSGGDSAMLARAHNPVWVGRRPLPALNLDEGPTG